MDANEQGGQLLESNSRRMSRISLHPIVYSDTVKRKLVAFVSCSRDCKLHGR